MGDAAGEDEDVPGGVEVANPVERKEDHAQRVGHAAGGQPEHGVPANGVEKSAGDKNYQPSLEEIHEGGSDSEAVDHEAFEDHTSHGESPDRGKECPAHRAAQRDEGKRCIRAGDEQVDGRVVENVKDVAGTGTHERVIEGGAEVHENQSGGEDGATDDEACRPARRCHDETHGTRDSESDADPMRDGVGKDIAQIGVSRHGLMIVLRH